VTGVSRVPSLRSNVFPCSECGETLTRSESLDLHQAVKHAGSNLLIVIYSLIYILQFDILFCFIWAISVSELGPEDNSRNIVEIIFKWRWLKKQVPMCKIERILKVHHTEQTISKFEVYRDSIKSKANKLAKKHSRCIADGNDLLRFHCTAFSCSLGLNGSTNLCVSAPSCGVCSIIRDEFKPDRPGKISTMATSGRAHDAAQISSEGKERAMLVCRVIARKVKKNGGGGSEECDSVAGTSAGVYSNLKEHFVSDPKAILPCFVVIYKSL